MLNVEIKAENPKVANLFKQKLDNTFPDIDTDQGMGVLSDFDEAYMAAREYFAYYFVMTTNEIIVYVNLNKIGATWQFITDAIFDEGINAIYRFIDKSSTKHGDILKRGEKIFGFSISGCNHKINDYMKRIMLYRNNRAAHFGNGYFEKISDIYYDDPIVILNQLRIDMYNFNIKYLDLENTIYDSLKIYFCEKIPSVSKLLNNKVDCGKIEEQLKQYLLSIIEDKEHLDNGISG